MGDLPKKERVCGRDDIARLFDQGTTGVCGGILVRALPGNESHSRIAAMAGKKLGNAVLRNRMKRRLRAAYRQEKDELPKGWDFALVARRGLLEAEWTDVIRDLKKAVAKAVTATMNPKEETTGHTGRLPSQRRR